MDERTDKPSIHRPDHVRNRIGIDPRDDTRVHISHLKQIWKPGGDARSPHRRSSAPSNNPLDGAGLHQRSQSALGGACLATRESRWRLGAGVLSDTDVSTFAPWTWVHGRLSFVSLLIYRPPFDRTRS